MYGILFLEPEKKNSLDIMEEVTLPQEPEDELGAGVFPSPAQQARELEKLSNEFPKFPDRDSEIEAPSTLRTTVTQFSKRSMVQVPESAPVQVQTASRVPVIQYSTRLAAQKVSSTTTFSLQTEAESENAHQDVITSEAFADGSSGF